MTELPEPGIPPCRIRRFNEPTGSRFAKELPQRCP